MAASTFHPRQLPIQLHGAVRKVHVRRLWSANLSASRFLLIFLEGFVRCPHFSELQDAPRSTAYGARPLEEFPVVDARAVPLRHDVHRVDPVVATQHIS